MIKISKMDNVTYSKFTTIDTTLTTPEKILIVVLWILIEGFGNGLLFGLIQFDRFGGDPLKRRIVDQVSYVHIFREPICN